ncbi:hypothetical protein NQ317_008377 [Molorchus minor]|uniref:Nucleoside phosphorylase domain-containing protein n=1 Tax=Molorchus minor TaxID=1323400 RepID=A0ABQ9K5P3_9CUCU|nr:hypothetical protein NQ317_008377 [Molorchus minor]
MNLSDFYNKCPTSPTAEYGSKLRFGESNVYTLGNIGAHRIVCTKLPSVGHTREAMTAAGNTTTRLLGTFQKVDYVFLVGVGGGVPHFTDYNKHVRLGDVVVSCPTRNKHVYLYCESAKSIEKGYEFEIKPYSPSNFNLQEIATQLKSLADQDSSMTPPWFNYLHDGLNILSVQTEPDFKQPNSETDKLYMSIGDRDLIEVAHPTPQDKAVKRTNKVEIRRKFLTGPPKNKPTKCGTPKRILKKKIIRCVITCVCTTNHDHSTIQDAYEMSIQNVRADRIS